MQVKLITPEKIFFSGDAVQVDAPGTEGVFGVLPGHAPFISTLKAGLVNIELASGEHKRFVVLSGIAEITPESVTLLAEVAEDCSGMNSADVSSRLSAAKSAMDTAIGEDQKKIASQSLMMAEAIADALKAA
ncbi:MAG: ATP synthase F1 subunit epsilon [Alphaproteobacteria bacterium]